MSRLMAVPKQQTTLLELNKTKTPDFSKFLTKPISKEKETIHDRPSNQPVGTNLACLLRSKLSTDAAFGMVKTSFVPPKDTRHDTRRLRGGADRSTSRAD